MLQKIRERARPENIPNYAPLDNGVLDELFQGSSDAHDLAAAIRFMAPGVTPEQAGAIARIMFRFNRLKAEPIQSGVNPPHQEPMENPWINLARWVALPFAIASGWLAGWFFGMALGYVMQFVPLIPDDAAFLWTSWMTSSAGAVLAGTRVAPSGKYTVGVVVVTLLGICSLMDLFVHFTNGNWRRIWPAAIGIIAAITTLVSERNRLP